MSEGQKLYQAYQEACLEINSCRTDGWDSLMLSEQEEWERTAEIYLNGREGN